MKLTSAQATALAFLTGPISGGTMRVAPKATAFALTERTARALADLGLVEAMWREVPHHNGRVGDTRAAIGSVTVTEAGRAAAEEN